MRVRERERKRESGRCKVRVDNRMAIIILYLAYPAVAVNA